MTIGIDADGVLFDYVRTCAEIVNETLLFPIAKYETANEFDVLRSWGVEHLKSHVDDAFSKQYAVADMPVLIGAVEFMQTVNQLTDGDFCIITACPANWHSEREWALNHYFDIPKEKVHFSRDKSKFKLRAMVDDYHQNLSGIDGWRILLDRPWNRDTQGVACQRVFGYDQAICEINRIVNWNK